jgi:succinyl-CoA synthetase beta subunit
MLVDRKLGGVTIICSTEGGMEIEEVAESKPEKIIHVNVDSYTGLKSFHVQKISKELGLSKNQQRDLSSLLQSLLRAFLQLDAAMIEINPLVITKTDDLLAIDAKMSFDDNALFRQPEVEQLRDESEEEPTEIEAAQLELNYIKLDGNIGCLVNGAGLAMATMDIIKLHGGDPANFLDVGGSATKERVAAAFKIIMSDENVSGILVNIFGGIMRCDIIAEGVVSAAQEIDLQVPLVVRLEGTNVEKGKSILAESGLPILSADNLSTAAQKIVDVVGKLS